MPQLGDAPRSVIALSIKETLPDDFVTPRPVNVDVLFGDTDLLEVVALQNCSGTVVARLRIGLQSMKLEVVSDHVQNNGESPGCCALPPVRGRHPVAHKRALEGGHGACCAS